MSSSAHSFSFLESLNRANYRDTITYDHAQSNALTEQYGSSNDLTRQYGEMQTQQSSQTLPDEQHQVQQPSQSSNGTAAPIAHMYEPQLWNSSSLFGLGAQPLPFNPIAFPVQPYGFGMPQNPHYDVDFQEQPMLGMTAPSYGTFDAQPANTMFQHLQQLPNPLDLWPLNENGVETPDHQFHGRTSDELGRDITLAHRRLNVVVGYKDRKQTLQDSVSSSKPAMDLTAGNGLSTKDAAGVATAPKSKPRIMKRKRNASMTAKSKRQLSSSGTVDITKADAAIKRRKIGGPKKTENVTKPTLALSVGASQAKTKRDDSVHTTGVDSDVDAEGDTEESFVGQSYTVTNGIARKAPSESTSILPVRSTQKLKITINNPNGSDSNAPSSARGVLHRGKALRPAVIRNGRRGQSRRGKAPSLSNQPDDNEPILDIPENLKNKEFPEDIDDLLSLIDFETQSYNDNPQREIELLPINRAIARENITRGVRRGHLERKLARESRGSVVSGTPGLPTRSSIGKQKRKVEYESPLPGRTTKPKARKTMRISDMLVAEPVVPDPGIAVVGHDVDTCSTKGLNSVPLANDASLGDDNMSVTECTDLDTAESTPMRSFRPQHEGLVLTNYEHEGAQTPQANSRKILKSEGEQREDSAAVHELLGQPKLEKVVHVPKAMSHLIARVKKANLGKAGEQGD